MSHHENLKVMVFLGLSEVSKSSAVEHFTTKGVPKVDLSVKQIHDLSEAGQHRVVMGGSYTDDEYKSLRHEFPGELTFVTIVQESNKAVPEDDSITTDYFVIDNGNSEDFAKQLDAIAEEIGF